MSLSRFVSGALRSRVRPAAPTPRTPAARPVTPAALHELTARVELLEGRVAELEARTSHARHPHHEEDPANA